MTSAHCAVGYRQLDLFRKQEVHYFQDRLPTQLYNKELGSMQANFR